MNAHSNKISPPADERGFTFVELLIVIAIFSIGILAVASMQVTAIHANSSARMSGEATALAVNQIEALLALDYNAEALSTDPNDHPPEFKDGYTINYTVTESDLDGDGTNDSKTVFVTVQCANPRANDVNFQYIIPET